MPREIPITYPDQIDRDILYAWGAVSSKYNKGDIVFTEGEQARSYFQIESGAVRMFNLSNEGKEFTQGIFYSGQSFGEPPLFIDEVYPAAAVACKPSVILRLSKSIFFNVLEEYAPIQRSIMRLLALRAYSKALSSRDLMIHNPEQRLLHFLKKCREQAGNPNNALLIPYTRQELANFTALRVETVIRTLSKMQNEGKVQIIDHKLYC